MKECSVDYSGQCRLLQVVCAHACVFGLIVLGVTLAGGLTLARHTVALSYLALLHVFTVWAPGSPSDTKSLLDN